jgi:adenylate cyclase
MKVEAEARGQTPAVHPDREESMRFSLQTRFIVYLLVPVALTILISAGRVFLRSRDFLIEQWVDSANIRLEKVAHEISWRLNEKLKLTELITKAETVPSGNEMKTFLIQELLRTQGVRSVDLDEFMSESNDLSGEAPIVTNNMVKTDRPQKRETRPQDVFSKVDMRVDTENNYLEIITVSGKATSPLRERLTVKVKFDSFIEHIRRIGLWEDAYTRLVMADGLCLASTGPGICRGRRLGDKGNPLEKEVLSQMKSRDYGTVLGPGLTPNMVISFHRIVNTDWYVVTCSSGSRIFAPMSDFVFFFAVAVMIAVGTAVVVILVTTRSVSTAIREISDSAGKVARGDYTIKCREDRSDEVGQLKRSFNKMIEGLKQRELIEQTFGRYIDKGIAEELLRSPDALNLGGEEKTVTIMMADLENFTPLADRLRPNEVIALLNRYLARMIQIIEQHRGIIVDFYGDGILVFFQGSDAELSSDAVAAVNCGQAMQLAIQEISVQNKSEGLPELSMRIGIHTGKVVVGNIGSETRAKYGIVGSAVNETDRIQSFGEGGSIIISGETRALLGDTVNVGPRCTVSLKGLNGSRDLYEVESVCEPDDFSQS